MNASRLALLALPLFLTACGLSPQEKADYAAVQRSGASSATYDKMVHGDALSLSDIKSLARARVNQGIILRYLREHETIYYLNSADITDLKNAGVSASVVDYMLQTPTQYGAGPYFGPTNGIGIYDPYFYGPGPFYGPGYYRHYRR